MTFKKLFLLSSPLGQKRLLWRRPGANYPRAKQSPSSPQESHPDPLWNSFHPGAFYQKETIFQQAGPLLGYRPVIGLHSASFLHLAPYQADGESLEGFHLPAAFGKWLPKPLSNLLPPGIRPPAQKLRGSSWPWFFLSQPPFPSATPHTQSCIWYCFANSTNTHIIIIIMLINCRYFVRYRKNI